MRILHFAPYSPKQVSGVANVITTLMRGMAERGHSSTYLTVARDGIAPRDIDLVEIPFEGPRFVRSMRARSWLRAWLKDNIKRYDVIHIHWPTWMAKEVMDAGKEKDVKSCLTLHGKMIGDSFSSQAHRKIAKKVVESADLVVSVNEDLKLIWERPDAQVIINGVDTNTFKPDGNMRRVTRKELGFENDFIIIFVGRVAKSKGMLDLLDAVEKLPFNVKAKTRLVVIGECEDEPIKETLESKGFVKYLGRRDDVAKHLQASDLFVLPSHSEGLPVSLLEAMSCGLPVIATPVGGIPSVVYEGQNGYLTKVQDPKGLADRIESIMNTPQLEFVGARARETIIEGYSKEKMVDGYVEEYGKLIS